MTGYKASAFAEVPDLVPNKQHKFLIDEKTFLFTEVDHYKYFENNLYSY